MRTFLVLLFLITPSLAVAVVEISQLPLNDATAVGSADSFPYVNSAENETERLLLDDLINLPTMVSTYAPLASPAFTGLPVMPTIKITAGAQAGYCWTALDNLGNGNWQICSGGGGSGVTSVGLTMPSWFTVANSPVTSAGTLAVSGTSQSPNLVVASPNGVSGAVAPRALTGADLPNPGASSLGGVKSLGATAHQWINTISTSGAPSSSQPAFTDISGTASVPQGGTGAGSFTSGLPLVGNGTSALGVGTITGNTTKFATSTGALTNGDCVEIDASGNFVDAGSACATISGGNLVNSGSDGITVSNGTGAVIGTGTTISQQAAGGSQNGYLSSTDWTTFNGKQASGNYITALTGDVTASGPGSVAATVAKIQGTTVSGVTGATNVMFSANPTTTGVLTAAAATFSGNVGLGTTNPSRKLEVNGTSLFDGNTRILGTTNAIQYQLVNSGNTGASCGIESSTGGSIFTGTTAYATVLGNSDSLPIQFVTNNAVAATISAARNVGIGTTNPTYPLSVAGNVGIGTTAGTVLVINRTAATAGHFSTLALDTIGGGGSGSWAIDMGSIITGNDFVIGNYTLGTPSLIIRDADSAINTTGNVGVGTTVTINKLAINGNVAAGSYSGTAAPSNGMIISGNVGVGTSSPVAKLEVSGAARIDGALSSIVTSAAAYNSQLLENSSSTGFVQQLFNVGSGGANGQGVIGYAPGSFFHLGPAANDTTSPVVIQTNNGAERMRVTAGGNVGIGTTSPGAVLSVVGLTTGTNADFLCLKADGSMLIQTSACTISSRRFKENISYLDDHSGLEEVMQLRPVEFQMKPTVPANADINATRLQTGLIAEEVEEVDPRLAIYEDDGITPKSYRQEAVISILIKAIQEQQKEIKTLQKRVGR